VGLHWQVPLLPQLVRPQQSESLLQLPPGVLQHTVSPELLTSQVVVFWPVSQHWLGLVQGCCKPSQVATQEPFWQVWFAPQVGAQLPFWQVKHWLISQGQWALL